MFVFISMPCAAFFNGLLAQNDFVRRLVEADDERPARAERGRAQIAGGPQEQLGEPFRRRLLLFQIHAHDPVAPASVEFARRAGQRKGLLLPQGRLPRVQDLRYRNFMFRKKLLRPAAGRSAGAVVEPLYLGHGLPFVLFSPAGPSRS